MEPSWDKVNLLLSHLSIDEKINVIEEYLFYLSGCKDDMNNLANTLDGMCNKSVCGDCDRPWPCNCNKSIDELMYSGIMK